MEADDGFLRSHSVDHGGENVFEGFVGGVDNFAVGLCEGQHLFWDEGVGVEKDIGLVEDFCGLDGEEFGIAGACTDDIDSRLKDGVGVWQ